jgi:uncharacterized protein (UPF0332 family)
MWNITDIIQSFLKPSKLQQKFRDKIRNLVKTNPADWDKRAIGCSRSLLTAVCFRETAIASVQLKESMIYQPIGLYYAMFHMSLAMLWLNPRIKSEDLTRIHHKKLASLVSTQLVQTNFIDSSYFDLLLGLKDLRESCNYQFGYRDNLSNEMTEATEKTETAFDNALQFIHQVLDASDTLFRVQVGIGDGFGDDILDSYLSPEHKDNVISYLVLNGLST